MTEVRNIFQDLVPLSRVVNAAIIDTYEQKSKVEQIYTHWAARGLFELRMQILKGGKRKVFLHVNKNLHTATLPPDFNGEIFVGIVKNGIKIPINQNLHLVDTKNIVDVPCEDKCEKCNANKEICNELSITTTTKTIEINAANYEQTITKKLYPNGDYFLETVMPFLDTETNTVIYRTSKEFVAHIDLKPCGCVEETEENIEKIKVCAPEVYCSYFAPCGKSKNLGGYQIFEESGLIQFSSDFDYDKIYLEYRASMLKINGQYQVPRIAFETLVEWIIFKSIKNKRNISRGEKRDQWEHYLIAKSNMSKLKSRTSLANLISSLNRIPKFDIYVENYDFGCEKEVEVVKSVPSSVCEDVPSAGGSEVGLAEGYVPYSFGVIAGMAGAPVDESSVWQSDFLKGALNLNYVILNDTVLTLSKGDFKFDSSEGKINISPNKFYSGDVLVGNYFKKASVPTGYIPYPFEAIISEDTSIYQSDSLKGAYGFDTLFVNGTTYQVKKGDFTFDSTNGIIDFSPNTFFQGDVLTSSYYKKP